MPKSKHSEAQIVAALKQMEAGRRADGHSGRSGIGGFESADELSASDSSAA